ncbi:MAG: hypothetical protein Unbinned338contig1000_29 [Prokaryotic dsDNA virus sp.]|nr:MAG: hypothetical protein Unbinned338contig1000_29 [Prokaryotic dsDNA virus sp.]|tara:strand:+ start:12783 stop:13280 length:498 start_codon:yes stop_codon:yes gene_type:complete
MSLTKAFRAGFVRRWHTNPELAHTNDRIDGHAGRVARIILMLYPKPSVELIRAALIHDDGESVVGDMGALLKTKRPDIARALYGIELSASLEIWGKGPVLSSDDMAWIKFADRLDAYMWAAHHAPQVMGGDGWPEAHEWLRTEGARLMIAADVMNTLRRATDATA